MPRPGSCIVDPRLYPALEPQFFTDRCSIQRDVAGTDATGMPLPADWQTVYEDVPCRFFPNTRGQSGSLPLPEGIDMALRPARMAFAVGTDVRERDRVVSVIDRDGNELAAQLTIDAPPAPHRAYLEVVFEEVT